MKINKSKRLKCIAIVIVLLLSTVMLKIAYDTCRNLYYESSIKGYNKFLDIIFNYKYESTGGYPMDSLSEDDLNYIQEKYNLIYEADKARRYFTAYKEYNKVVNEGKLTKEIYDSYCENYPEENYYIYDDIDGDGLNNYKEFELYGTDPNKFSTSNDTISDGYKVLNGLDVNKYYKPFWVKYRDNLYVKSFDKVGSFIEGEGDGIYGVQNYLGLKDVYLVYFPRVYGNIKFNIPGVIMSKMEFEKINTFSLTRDYIPYKFQDNFIEFDTDEYSAFILYPKGFEFDLQDWYMNHLDDPSAVEEIVFQTFVSKHHLQLEDVYGLDSPSDYEFYSYKNGLERVLPMSSMLQKYASKYQSKYDDIVQIKLDLENRNYETISDHYNFKGLDGKELETIQREKMELLIKLAKEYILNTKIDYNEEHYKLDEKQRQEFIEQIEKIKNSDVVNE